MKVRSTGLGKTLLEANLTALEVTTMVPSTLEPGGDQEPKRLLMGVEAVKPVHWQIKVFIEPSDMRAITKVVLRNLPSLLAFEVSAFFKNGKPSGAKKA